MTRAPAGRPAEAHDRGYDPVTGYDLVGHEWNGITELNTPLPKIAVIALLLAFIYSVICWILLPAWPTGTGCRWCCTPRAAAAGPATWTCPSSPA